MKLLFFCLQFTDILGEILWGYVNITDWRRLKETRQINEQWDPGVDPETEKGY